jgi:NTP pyrophosphatase (non-canonical NTP hydrolase)
MKVETEYPQPLLRFAMLMQDKLDENCHKRGWSDLSPAWLLRRMREETGEIRTALRKKKDALTIARECADVANFAMMLADNLLNNAEELKENG